MSFGDVHIDAFSRVAPEIDAEAATTAAKAAETFRGIPDARVEPAVCWLADRGPTDPLEEEDIERIGRHVLLATVAAIAENEYLGHLESVNASHFRRVQQNFVVGGDRVALVRRRRDGQTISSGWTFDQIKITPPSAAGTQGQAHWNQEFLDALATCLTENTPVDNAIVGSALWFVQGSELDDHGSHLHDLVFIVSALEQLCMVEGRNRRNKKMAKTIREVLGEHWTDKDKRWLRKWMAESYAKRSELHGRSANRDRWPNWALSLLSSVAYCLLVKARLEADSRYTFSCFDLDEIEAFPARIACLAEHDNIDDAARKWTEARSTASFAVAIRQACAHPANDESRQPG